LLLYQEWRTEHGDTAQKAVADSGGPADRAHQNLRRHAAEKSRAFLPVRNCADVSESNTGRLKNAAQKFVLSRTNACFTTPMGAAFCGLAA
jgi:hypothetical protein